MEKEDIEKAAEEYTNDVCRSSLHRCGLEQFCMVDFIEGAKWRINSVWHDVKETPLYKFILIDMGERFDVIRIESDIWPYYVENYRAKRYAYIEDLLPTK